MKRIIQSLLILQSIMLLTSSCSTKSNEKDDTPKEVKIGTQVWMTRNLATDTFRNGDPIFEAKTDDEWLNACLDEKPAWCYYRNEASNGSVYGKLYNWFAVIDSRGLAPLGWHIPNDNEWNQLITHLGGKDSASMLFSFLVKQYLLQIRPL